MKKFISILCLLLVTVSLFAGNTVDSSDMRQAEAGKSLDSENIAVKSILINNPTGKKTTVVNPFAGAWGFYLNIIVVLGGGMMLLRFAVELVGAIIFSTEDSTVEVRKVIVRLAVHLGVVGLSFGLLYLIF